MRESGDTDVPRAWLVTLLGLLLGTVVSIHLFTEHFPNMHSASDPVRIGLLLIELMGMIGPPIGLVYLGIRVAARRYSRDVEWEFVLWTLMGLIAVSTVITGIAIHRTINGIQVLRSLFLMELLTGAGVGALLGAVVGMSRASTTRERKTVESQRDAFQFLNKLLRHHVLNSLTVIDGFAERSREHVTGDGENLLDTIHEHVEGVTGLVRNVDTVVQTYTGEPPRKTLALRPMLESEVEQVRRSYPEVTIRADLDPVQVDGNELLAVVFRNLLENAAMYNTADDPWVDVTTVENAETVSVVIEDNGPGIPDEERVRIRELGDRGDRGIGLYLANRLISQLGGDLKIETHEEAAGTTVTVTLRKPSPGQAVESTPGWPIAPPIGQIE